MNVRNNASLKGKGFTLVEVLVTVAIVALVMVALGRVVGQSLHIQDASLVRQELTRQVSFAMARMTRAVRGAEHLLVPLDENSATGWSESVRDVLAVTLDPAIDRDQDGWADADKDQDGRVDEDLKDDNSADWAAGIVGIDDNGDGIVDSGFHQGDDDEDGFNGEDPINGIDDDNDGTIDEDPGNDMNNDNFPGLHNFDDDDDGMVDEGGVNDDDEDGSTNEDHSDPVVFFLSGTTLMERTPVTWDENSDATVDGLDFVENPVADNVSQFQVERVSVGSKKNILVDISLTLASGPDTITLQSRTRLGGSK